MGFIDERFSLYSWISWVYDKERISIDCLSFNKSILRIDATLSYSRRDYLKYSDSSCHQFFVQILNEKIGFQLSPSL